MKGIYKITNLINNKVYIGQTDRFNHREREHFYRLENNVHHNEHLQKAFNKYGKENFIIELIVETEDLNEMELFYINEYGGIDSDLNYNMKDPVTMKWSEYVRVKQRKAMTGKNNPNYGKKWSQEQKDNSSKKKKGVTLEDRLGKEKADLAKEKMRKSQTGRKHPEEVKEKIRKGNSGVNSSSYGKGYRQIGDKNPMWGKVSSNRKPVLCYTIDDILVKEYDYLSLVIKDGFNIGNVASVANGRKNYKTAGGYIWKFKE